MKIAFVCSEDKWLGLGYLSSYIKANGHQVSLLFDPMLFNKSYIRNERLKRILSREKQFIGRLKEVKPDLIGFSVVAANYQWALNLAGLFRQYFNIPIIFGGPHATILPEEVIARPQIDMVAIGEAEESLLELLNSGLRRKNIRGIWFKDGFEIIKNPLMPLEMNIDKYPFPDEDMFFRQLPCSYRITPSLITSRGCPFSCSYCGNQIIQKIYKDSGLTQWVRQRSVGNVISELAWRKESHGSRHFVFMDDIFSFNMEWLRGFVSEYKKHIKLPFNCLAHPGIAKIETISLLKDAGCTLIDFGLQSGSAAIRKEVLKRNEKDEDVIKIANACRKYKLKFAVDCILNLPFDTEKTIKESLRLFNVLRPSMINCFPLAYLPRTQIIDIAQNAGVLSAEDVNVINKGKHIVYFSFAINKRKSLDDYRRYSFLFTALPILPSGLLNLIINNDFLFKFCQRVPRIFLIASRLVVQFRAGFWFIFSNVINNEIFYLKQNLPFGQRFGASFAQILPPPFWQRYFKRVVRQKGGGRI